jgi:hypothetical protein
LRLHDRIALQAHVFQYGFRIASERITVPTAAGRTDMDPVARAEGNILFLGEMLGGVRFAVLPDGHLIWRTLGAAKGPLRTETAMVHDEAGPGLAPPQFHVVFQTGTATLFAGATGTLPKRVLAVQDRKGLFHDLDGWRLGDADGRAPVGQTVMGNPKLILLDEPSEGIAPVIIEKMAEVIAEFKTAGLTVLLSEQNLHFAKLVSDKAYIIESGEMRYEGTIAELESNAEVREKYLAV